MRPYIFSFSTILILMLASCTKEIPFSDEAKTSKLVINSLFSNDSAWSINVSRSVSVLDADDNYGMDTKHYPVENATVNIFDKSNQKVATLTHLYNGEYTDSGSFPVANQEYRLEVSAPDFKSVSATNTLPSPVPITSIDTASFTDHNGTKLIQVTLNFDDPIESNNYYLVELMVYDRYSDMYDNGSSINYAEPYAYRVGMRTNDPNIEKGTQVNMDGFEDFYPYLMLKDDNFNGEHYSLTFTSTLWSMGDGSQMTGKLRLLNTSKAFFNYRLSYERYTQSNGDPFAQPSQVYSNIDNGIGIFAGGTLTTFDLEF